MSSLGRVLVVGATGAVGQQILLQLEELQSINEIAVLTRRTLDEGLKTPKVREYIMDFDKLDARSECFAVDAVFCALGTTRKKAGSQKAFRKVDHDYPMAVAKICKSRGVKHFLIVTAMGADDDSLFFYNRVKGEVEKDLTGLNFPSLTIVRPSVLIRDGVDPRHLETIAQKVGAFFPKRWKSVSVSRVASALIRSLQNPSRGLRIIENAEIFG